MSTDLLIDAIERLESAIAEAKETTRECHEARKDLKAAQKEFLQRTEMTFDSFVAMFQDTFNTWTRKRAAPVINEYVSKMKEALAGFDAEASTVLVELQEVIQEQIEWMESQR